MSALTTRTIPERPKAIDKVESDANSTETPQSTPLLTRAVDVTRFATTKLQNTQHEKKFSLKIDIEYPQLSPATTTNELRFNRLVRNGVADQLLRFTNYLKEKESKVRNKIKPEFEINLNYKIKYLSDKFTSVAMNWNAFSGYLNYDYFPSTINYEFIEGKELAMDGIFKPNSKYLEPLSEISRRILKRTCLSCPCERGINAGEPLPDDLVARDDNKAKQPNSNTVAVDSWLNTGLNPEKENFNNWGVTDKGLTITIGEYQVGPGCIGIITIVIPFSELEPILKKNLSFIPPK